MSIDSFHMIQEFHNVTACDSCSCICDSLNRSHWYNFYNDAYSNLVATQSGLFGALLTAAVTIFCIKLIYDNYIIDKKIKKALDDFKLELGTESIKTLNDTRNNFNNDANLAINDVRANFINVLTPQINDSNIAPIKIIINEFLNTFNNSQDNTFVDSIIDCISNFFEKIKSLSKDTLKQIKSSQEFKLQEFIDKVKEFEPDENWYTRISYDSIKEIEKKINEN